jgi:DNA-directed RNA polymerase specialized sigma24 family protein
MIRCRTAEHRAARYELPPDQDQEKAMATNPALTQQASRRRDDPVVTGLVTRARNGDQQAWDALVDRYAPLIWSICRRHRLEAGDAQDAAQTVWLKLLDHLESLRDPAALPGWLATTTRRECGRILHTALREAFGQLPLGCQRLLALLIHDPAFSDNEISARLGIPVGAIGPSRRRCLDKLRRHPAIAALINASTQTARPPHHMHHRSERKGHLPMRASCRGNALRSYSRLLSKGFTSVLWLRPCELGCMDTDHALVSLSIHSSSITRILRCILKRAHILERVRIRALLTRKA